MKIRVQFFSEATIEVDDKFNCLAADDPKWGTLNEDLQEEYQNELIRTIKEKTNIPFLASEEKHIPYKQYIADVYREEDNSAIMQY